MQPKVDMAATAFATVLSRSRGFTINNTCATAIILPVAPLVVGVSFSSPRYLDLKTKIARFFCDRLGRMGRELSRSLQQHHQTLALEIAIEETHLALMRRLALVSDYLPLSYPLLSFHYTYITVESILLYRMIRNMRNLNFRTTTYLRPKTHQYLTVQS
jgi:hypothetical protein